MPTSACLLAEYPTTLTPPWKDSSDAIEMIFPVRRASMHRPTACVMVNTASRLVVITASQSSPAMSTAGERWMIPA